MSQDSSSVGLTAKSCTSFIDLKQDCCLNIWQYIPSSQLFECISSLRSSAQLRELSVLALTSRAPLSLVQVAQQTDCWPYCALPHKDILAQYGVFYLKDRNEEVLVTIDFYHRRGLQYSPLYDLVEHVNLLIGVDGCRTVGFWSDLILPLPNLTAISLTDAGDDQAPCCKQCQMSPQAGEASACNHAFMRRAALRVFTRSFQPFFANLQAFALLNWDLSKRAPYNDTGDVRVLLQDMTQLRRLEIPSYLLDQISTRQLGDRWTPLEQLTVYAHAPQGSRHSADFETVAELCPELANFKYICRFPWKEQNEACKEIPPSLAPLLALSKLRTLSLDVGECRPHRPSGAALLQCTVPLTELHLTYRRQNEFACIPESLFLFTHVATLDSLHIWLEHAGQIVWFIEQLRSVAQISPIAHLRMLKIELAKSTLSRANQAEQNRSWDVRAATGKAASGKFLASLIDLCPNLASIDASGVCIELGGYLASSRYDPATAFANGFWSIRLILGALKAAQKIRFIKLRAKLDSIAALQTELPEDCAIFEFAEKPIHPSTAENYVSDPDKYWNPVSLLIIGQKENLNTFHLHVKCQILEFYNDCHLLINCNNQ